MSATASPLHYSEEELLSSGSFREPLFANGVRCHGGFDDEGRYCSPRVLFRNPAINAWQDRLRQGGTQRASQTLRGTLKWHERCTPDC